MSKLFYKLHELAEVRNVSVEDILQEAAAGVLSLSLFWDRPVYRTCDMKEVVCEFINLPRSVATSILVNNQSSVYTPERAYLPWQTSAETAFLLDGTEVVSLQPVSVFDGVPTSDDRVRCPFVFELRAIVVMVDEAEKLIADETEELIEVPSGHSGNKIYTGKHAIMAAWAAHGQKRVGWSMMKKYRGQGLQIKHIIKDGTPIPTCTDSAMMDFIYEREMKKNKKK